MSNEYQDFVRVQHMKNKTKQKQNKTKQQKQKKMQDKKINK